MWQSTKLIKVGLVVSFAFFAAVLPVPDGRMVTYPPRVITAREVNFKVKPQKELKAFALQPMVYCSVTVC